MESGGRRRGGERGEAGGLEGWEDTKGETACRLSSPCRTLQERDAGHQRLPPFAPRHTSPSSVAGHLGGGGGDERRRGGRGEVPSTLRLSTAGQHCRPDLRSAEAASLPAGQISPAPPPRLPLARTRILSPPPLCVHPRRSPQIGSVAVARGGRGEWTGRGRERRGASSPPASLSERPLALCSAVGQSMAVSGEVGSRPKGGGFWAAPVAVSCGHSEPQCPTLEAAFAVSGTGGLAPSRSLSPPSLSLDSPRDGEAGAAMLLSGAIAQSSH